MSARAAAQARAVGPYDRQRKGHRNGGVHGIAAGLKDLETRARSEFGVRGHNRMLSGNHAAFARDVGSRKCESGNR